MASVLVVGPHPDDQELGAGGTMALLARQGHRVTILDLTNGEPTPFGDPETRAMEAEAARLALCPPSPAPGIRRLRLTMKNRSVTHTLEARHAVAGIIRAVQADIVMCPYFEDAHPDHLACTRIVEDARFDAKLTKLAMPGDEGMPPLYPKWLWYYFASHLRYVPEPSFILDVSTTMDAKLAAVKCYESQFTKNPKNRGFVDYVRTEAAYFGSKIGATFGEGFFSREPLGLRDIASVVGI